MVLHLPITNDTTDNHPSNTAHAFTTSKKKASRKVVRFAEDTLSNQVWRFPFFVYVCEHFSTRLMYTHVYPIP